MTCKRVGKHEEAAEFAGDAWREAPGLARFNGTRRNERNQIAQERRANRLCFLRPGLCGPAERTGILRAGGVVLVGPELEQIPRSAPTHARVSAVQGNGRLGSFLSRPALLVREAGEGGGESFVPLEEELKAPALIGERLTAVAPLDRAVERFVRPAEGGGHRERIVEVGQRSIGKLPSRIEHSLRRLFDTLLLRIRRRVGPGEVVVDEFG